MSGEKSLELISTRMQSYRKNATLILGELSQPVTRRNPGYRLSSHQDRKRLAALIHRHFLTS